MAWLKRKTKDGLTDYEIIYQLERPFFILRLVKSERRNKMRKEKTELNWITAEQKKKLRRELKKKGFLQYRLARRVKIDPVRFSRLVNGWWPVSSSFWREIEKALGKRDSYFTSGK
jgi:hypothetical protein